MRAGNATSPTQQISDRSATKIMCAIFVHRTVRSLLGEAVCQGCEQPCVGSLLIQDLLDGWVGCVSCRNLLTHMQCWHGKQWRLPVLSHGTPGLKGWTTATKHVTSAACGLQPGGQRLLCIPHSAPLHCVALHVYACGQHPCTLPLWHGSSPCRPLVQWHALVVYYHLCIAIVGMFTRMPATVRQEPGLLLHSTLNAHMYTALLGHTRASAALAAAYSCFGTGHFSRLLNCGTIECYTWLACVDLFHLSVVCPRPE